MEEFLQYLIKKKKEKEKEYDSQSNPFRSFENAVGISLHNSKEKVLWEYMTKHLESIKHWVETNERNISNELIDEKIGDIISYLLILRKMLKQ